MPDATRRDVNDSAGHFEVAVALVPLETVLAPTHESSTGGLPGADDVLGLRRSELRPRAILEKGEEAVQQATEALAAQIGAAAERIASAISRQAVSSPGPGELALDSVEVSFGITLSGGVQAFFTARAESSVQVTIHLARQHQESVSDPA